MLPGGQFLPLQYIYCEVWSEADREAFWKGFLDRAGELGDDFVAIWEWLNDAVGLGDEEGDFAKAWEAFGKGIKSLAELTGKLMVVIGYPWPLRFHPQRDAYTKQMKDLGITLTKEVMKGYETAYDEGGIPQCTGRLFADVLAIILEIVVTKGAGKALKAAKLGKLAAKLPNPLKKKLNKLKQGAVSRRLAVLKRRIKRALDDPNPDIQLEGKVAQKYLNDVVEFQKHRYPSHHGATGAPKSIPHPSKPGKKLSNIEIDIELRNSIVECTTGKNNKFGQLQKSINTLRGNPTKKHIIVFNPVHKYSQTQIKQLKNLPRVHVAQDWDELDKLIKKLGR